MQSRILYEYRNKLDIPKNNDGNTVENSDQQLDQSSMRA